MRTIERPSQRELPAPWSVERSTHVIKNRWISVRADSCRTAEGVCVDPYYVLEYPDWVQIVAVDEDDHLILTRQYRHGIGYACLEIPAGAMEPRDDGAMEAARRELGEETGYAAEIWRHVITLAPNPANQTNRCHVFLALGAKKAVTTLDDPTERLQIVRVPVGEAAHLARGGAIVQMMHVAALAVALTDIGKWHPQGEDGDAASP